jgi:hypothetical protein
MKRTTLPSTNGGPSTEAAQTPEYRQFADMSAAVVGQPSGEGALHLIPRRTNSLSSTELGQTLPGRCRYGGGVA